MPLLEEVVEHLGGCGGHIADVHEGQVTEKEVHGVWRWESILIKMRSDRFQVRVKMYITRNTTKSTTMILGKSENPNRIK